MAIKNTDSFGDAQVGQTTLPCGAVVNTEEKEDKKDEVVGDKNAPCLISFYRSDKINKYGTDDTYPGSFGFDRFDSNVVAQSDIIHYEKIKEIQPKVKTIDVKNYTDCYFYLCPILALWSPDKIKEVESEVEKSNLEDLKMKLEKEKTDANQSEQAVLTNEIVQTEATIKSRINSKITLQSQAVLTIRVEETQAYENEKEKPKKFKIRLDSRSTSIKMSHTVVKMVKVEGAKKETDVEEVVENKSYIEFELEMKKTKEVTITCNGNISAQTSINAILLETDGKSVTNKPIIGKLNIVPNDKVFMAQLRPIVVSANPNNIAIDDRGLVNDLNTKSMNQSFIRFTLLKKYPLFITRNEIRECLDSNALKYDERTKYNGIVENLYKNQILKGRIAGYETAALVEADSKSKIRDKAVKFLEKFKKEVDFDINKKDFFYIKDRFEADCVTKAWDTFTKTEKGKLKNKQWVEYVEARDKFFKLLDGADDKARADIREEEIAKMKNEKKDVDSCKKEFRTQKGRKPDKEEVKKIEENYKDDLNRRIEQSLKELKEDIPSPNEATNIIKMYITDMVQNAKPQVQKEPGDHVPGYSATGDGSCHIFEAGLGKNGIMIHELGHALGLNHIFWDKKLDNDKKEIPEPVFMYNPDTHSGEIKQKINQPPTKTTSTPTLETEPEDNDAELKKNIGEIPRDFDNFKLMDAHYSKNVSKKGITLTEQEKYNLFNMYKKYIWFINNVSRPMSIAQAKQSEIIGWITQINNNFTLTPFNTPYGTNQDSLLMVMADYENKEVKRLSFGIKTTDSVATTPASETTKDYTGYIELRTRVDQSGSKDNIMDYNFDEKGNTKSTFDYKTFRVWQWKLLQSFNNLLIK